MMYFSDVYSAHEKEVEKLSLHDHMLLVYLLPQKKGKDEKLGVSLALYKHPHLLKTH